MIREFLRRWFEDEPRRRDAARALRSFEALNRQISELRGLLYQQADFTVEALRRAGWQSDEEALEQTKLHQALRAIEGEGDVIAGPWTGEVGFELLYWIPFLNWLVGQGLDPRRLVVVSRGGAAAWYSHLTTRYVDALELLTPDQFRERTSEGKRKQFDARRELDRDILHEVKARLRLTDPAVVHPSAMFRLFSGLWQKRSTIDLVEKYTTYQALVRPAAEIAGELPDDLPPGYVVAKFYFSKAFPDTADNRRFVADLLRRVAREAPVALLSTSVQLDDHRDFQTSGHSGLFVIDAHRSPAKNLERQTQIISGARGFVGTYGGFSYLAPFYGVRSVSFFSRRHGFKSHHLDVANRVFDKLLPGGFVVLDRRAGDLVEPAVARWTTSVPDKDSGAAASALASIR